MAQRRRAQRKTSPKQRAQSEVVRKPGAPRATPPAAAVADSEQPDTHLAEVVLEIAPANVPREAFTYRAPEPDPDILGLVDLSRSNGLSGRGTRLLLAGAILALICLGGVVWNAAHAALPANTRLTVVPTPSNLVDTRYRDGDDSTETTPLVLAAPADVRVDNGSTGSFNFRTAYLTEPGTPSATLTFNCTPTLAGGFTAGADGLSWAATTSYSGICTLTATRLANSSSSSQFVVASTAGATDTLAPPVPVNFTATGISGGIRFEWDPSSDNAQAGQGDGVTSYNIRRNGSTVIASPTQEAGKTAQFQVFDVGGATGESAVQSGNGVALATGIAASALGIDGTSSHAVMWGDIVSGSERVASAQVTAVAGAGLYEKAGVMLSAGTDAASLATEVFGAAYVIPVDAGYVVECRTRNAPNTVSTNRGYAIFVTLPIPRSYYNASGWDCGAQVDGVYTEIVRDYTALVLPQTGFAGGFLTATATTTATATLANLNVSTRPRQSTDYVTASSGTFEIRASDGTNASAYSSSISGAPASGSSTAKKKHFGHVMYLSGMSMGDNATSRKTSHFSQIDADCNNPDIVAVQWLVAWRLMEGPTRGDYSRGYALIDEYAAKAASCGFGLHITVQTGWFGGFGGGATAIFPEYLVTGAYGPVQSAGACVQGQPSGRRVGGVILSNGTACAFTGSLTAKAIIWEAPVMDAYIELQQAMGARYNANATIHGWGAAAETAVGIPSSYGYTLDAHFTQMKRMMPLAAAAWPNTPLRLWANYGGSDAQMASLLAVAAANGYAIGGPDVLPTQKIQANMVFRGYGRVNNIWTAGQFTDYAGVVPWISEIEDPELSSPSKEPGAPFLPQTFINHALNGETGIPPTWSQWFFWIRNDYTPPSSYSGYQQFRWATGILPTIEANQGRVGTGTSGTLTAPESVPCPTAWSCP
jgi:hypothetical protein